MNNEQLLEGYKQTEIGVIPEDWEAPKLEQMTNLIIDGTHLTPQYTNYGIPFLRVTDLQSSTIDLESLKFISIEEHQLLKKRCNPERRDLLLSKNGTIGLTKVVEWDWEFSIFVSLALIKVKKEKLDVYYLNQLFKSNFISDQLRKRAKQGTVTNLHLEEIRELVIPIPSSSTEQTLIAQTLSDVDALIAALEKAIAKKRHLKTATMQQLLTGKKRLPGFGEGKGYKESEIGVIPLDWEVIPLEKISVITRLAGEEYSSVWKETPNGEIIALRGFNIGKNKIIEKDFVRISNELSLKLKRSRLYRRDVIYPCVGTIGNAVVIEENDKYHIQQNIAKITPNKDFLYPYYLANYLMSFYGDAEVERFNATSSQPNVLVSSLRQYRVPLPSQLKEQRAIATVLSDMDGAIAALETRRAKTQAIKQGMMQALLTGRVRLKIEE